MEEKRIFLQPPIWLPILVALIVGGAYIAGKKIEVRGTPATISISGDGKVSAVPDIAMLSFGVQTGRVSTSQHAIEKLTADMNSVIDAVQKAGIEEKDIQTEYLNLFPAYDWKDGEQIPRGFEANQSLRVKVRNLDKVGEVLTAATAAGANQIGSVSFTIDDQEELQRQAREQAIADAQEKAKLLASDLGVSLGKLMGFNEGGSPTPVPMYDRAMGVGIGGGVAEAMPVPSGEQELSVMVTLTYEIE